MRIIINSIYQKPIGVFCGHAGLSKGLAPDTPNVFDTATTNFITKEFVEMLIGEIHADNAEGKGSTFTVVLPYSID